MEVVAEAWSLNERFVLVLLDALPALYLEEKLSDWWVLLLNMILPFVVGQNE